MPTVWIVSMTVCTKTSIDIKILLEINSNKVQRLIFPFRITTYKINLPEIKPLSMVPGNLSYHNSTVSNIIFS